jgi:hypothetical protein
MKCLLRTTLHAALLALALFVSGCQWNKQTLLGEGFNDELTGASKQMRRGKSDGTALGASQKALDIEENLGYR